MVPKRREDLEADPKEIISDPNPRGRKRLRILRIRNTADLFWTDKGRLGGYLNDGHVGEEAEDYDGPDQRLHSAIPVALWILGSQGCIIKFQEMYEFFF
jgi:hypothetical protein